MKKIKRIVFWGIIAFYAVSVIGYSIGKIVAEIAGLEYRYWVEQSFRCIVWFVPVLIISGMILYFYKRQREKNPKISWLWSGLIIVYILALFFLSLIYMTFSMTGLSSDQKMADGNLVVVVPEGLEQHCHYAEPVGSFFRRDMVFDDERLADSLSKIYDLDFQPQKDKNGDTVFVSTEYPDLEVRVIRYGYSEVTYLDTNLSYILTSQLLEKHRKIFDKYDVELATYVYRITQENKEIYDTWYGVLITEENKENAAKAITEFIQTTLKEDVRTDGESCWSSVDGSIFLLAKNTQTEENRSLRNIPFSLTPDHWWFFDETVTNAEILEEISEALK